MKAYTTQAKQTFFSSFLVPWGFNVVCRIFLMSQNSFFTRFHRQRSCRITTMHIAKNWALQFKRKDDPFGVEYWPQIIQQMMLFVLDVHVTDKNGKIRRNFEDFDVEIFDISHH